MKPSWTKIAIASAAVAAVAVGVVVFVNLGGAESEKEQSDASTADPDPSRKTLVVNTISTVNGTVDSEEGEWKAQRSYLNREGSVSADAKAYSIDMTTEEPTGVSYEEDAKQDEPIDGIEYIQWLMLNAYPSTDSDKLAQDAGVDDLSDDASEKGAATTATQAAVWHYAHGFEMDPDNPTPGSDDTYDTVVTGIYDYLLENASKQQEQSKMSFQLKHSDSGDKTGPFTIETSREEAKIDLEVDGGKIKGAEGESVRVDNGEEFYLERSDDAQEVVIKASTKGVMPAGTLYARDGEEGPQMMVLAEPNEETRTISFNLS